MVTRIQDNEGLASFLGFPAGAVKALVQLGFGNYYWMPTLSHPSLLISETTDFE
jgi:hypothetical protein